ncbi:hypothetical protein P170DRAFT_150930 [Aspergillus steynii IBT 23096]|uniref:GPI anchored protein n=1 Tax=Aspergillus steynii IBT 23096 TaxID=1392250 RepID=A0A2I2GCR7_9EURO|nr:uncharacterized protein P170DRAFT_150930 [Aspergillus steynii IBT 23096]PLB50673.1 hypothetical protein P170DRAFT_150930 [Aspergillus steynii IBT 23096]
MHLQSLYLAFLASVTSVVANDVVSIFLPEADPQPIVGKVIGVDGPVTSYVLYCAPGTDDDECGLPSSGYTVAQGPSTYHMIYSYQDYVQSQGCKLGNKSVITCEVKMHDATTTREDSAVLTTTDMPYLPVTITATETGASNKATASATASAKSTLATTASATSGASASATGSDASASATDSSNAALAQATGHAGWVAGGAAMALALAMA